MKILILVMSSTVGHYPKLIQKQRETWDSAPHPNTETIYYYAGPFTELIGDRLMVDVKEGHGYFYIKTMLAFEYLLNTEWDYILKTDNSAYIDKEELVKVLEDKPRSGFYGGHLYQTYTKSDPFLWGEGVIFSRDVIQYLVNEYSFSSIGRSGVEDVHIGMILQTPFNKAVNWDTSLTIYEYYKAPHLRGHIYRCKNEDSKQDLIDQLQAMDKLHLTLHPVQEPVDDKKSHPNNG